MAEKFIYAVVADDNATAWPLSKLIDIRYVDNTSIDLFFEGKIGADSADKLRLTTVAGKSNPLMQELCDVFYNHKSGAIIKIGDNVKSEFVSSNISAIASITLAS